MKATSLFGGVQVFQIIITIVRSKFIAVLLGPYGIGISGLLTTTTSMIGSLTNFGLSTSAVKDISEAHSTGDKTRVSSIVTVFRKWIWITGLLGTVLTILLSPWLSQITFGNKDYTFAFIMISITLLLSQLSAGQSVLLRGMRQIKDMAKSGIIGSIIGLIVTLPLYYYFGLNGIVPGIIITSIVILILPWYYARKLDIKSIPVTRTQIISEGKGMLKVGFMVSLSGIIGMAAFYSLRIFISNTGNVEQVGLFNAGFAIIKTYVGMIFLAISADFYPRLSAIAHDKHKAESAINQQTEIAILLIAPIATFFLVFIHWVVILFYSNKFVAINEMILWATLGMYFRAASYSLSYVFLAKGSSRLYFWNESSFNLYLLALNIIGYWQYGLTGLGISFLAAYIIYFFQVFIIARINYSFSFSKDLLKILIIQFVLVITCFFIVKYLEKPLSYILGSAFILASSLYSYFELEKKLGINGFKKLLGNKFKINRQNE